MRINRKALIVMITLLILSWTGNLTYFSYYQLKKPLILSHYTDYLVYSDQTAYFELYYITNDKGNVDLREVELPNGMPLFAQVRNARVNDSGLYILKRASIEIHRPFFDNLTEKEDLKFNTLTLHFSDGSVESTNVGEIILRKKKETSQEAALTSVESGTSNNNVGFHLFTVEKPLRIESIEYPFKEKLQGIFQMSVAPANVSWLERRVSMDDKVDHARMSLDQNALLETVNFPIQLAIGDSLKVAYQFDFTNKSDLRRYDFYKLRTIIQYTTEDGQKETTEVEMHYIPQFQEEEILKLVRERRRE